MGQLNLANVTKSFGQTHVIKGVDLEVKDGEFCVFVGPSGCGKSTLLRIIAGLEDATSGDILIDGRRVNATAPADREIAMVFQSYALYPHLTVKDNMALGLKQAGTAKATIEERVSNASRMLSLDPLLARRPSELSGGQRQRVAIGRAIVRTPKLFLFDEPLSNLDAALRVNTRIEIARLHRELAATMIYVTHDQVEAMTLADKIVVLDHGVISQVGTPMELYNAPANKFVASFIGAPSMNFVAVEARSADGREAVVNIPGGREIKLTTKKGLSRAGEGFEVGIRPEHVRLGAPGDPSASLGGTVQILERLGNATIMYVETPAGQIVVQDDGDAPTRPGDNVGVIFDSQRVHLFSSDQVAV